MDAAHFDSLIRSLTTASSRRGALVAIFGGTLGLRGLAQPDAAWAISGKCKPMCAECKKCKKGTCKTSNSGKKRCKQGKCRARAPGTPCPLTTGGICLKGICHCPGGLTTCGGTCVDTKSDAANCGTCGAACLANQVCLSNGSCATVCGSGCGCSLTPASVEGPGYCGPLFLLCNQYPTPCTTTSECPQGQFCANVSDTCGTDRCWPLA